MEVPYAKERKIAELAVQRASVLTKTVLAAVDKGLLSKSDDTPVTIADFAAQALLIGAIHHHFPNDQFVGEEAADTLREDLLLQRSVWALVSSTHLDDAESDGLLFTPTSTEEMLDVIDLGGRGTGGRKGRVWMLDPVDGTEAFIRGQQYAVCLALVEDGQEKIGVLGCPNLNLETGKVEERSVDKLGYGFMLSAIKDQGTTIRRMSRGALLPARAVGKQKDVLPADLKFVDCTKNMSLSHEKHQKIAKRLGVSWPMMDLWSSQMRYVALTVGGGNAMVRVPKSATKRSYVWDHAGGHLIYVEAGGRITDLNEKEFDFGAGRILENNFGLVAAPKNMHAELLKITEVVR